MGHIEDEGVSPTYDELHDRVRAEIPRRSAVHGIVQSLVREGFIRKDERLKSRNIWPVLDATGKKIHHQGKPVPGPVRVVTNRDAERMEIMLRAAVPVLLTAATHIDNDEHREPLVRLAVTIDGFFKHASDS